MQEFAINYKALIAQIINFLVLLFLLSKFAYKPVISMLQDRKERISRGLKDAEEANKTLLNAEAESDAKKEKAYHEANLLIENAKKEAQEKSLTLLNKANEQADLIIKKAEEEASQAKTKAMIEAKKEIGGLVTLALDKIVGDELDESQKNNLTKKAVEKL